MSSKKDLTDQLELTTLLSAQTEKLLAMSEKLEKSYIGQLDTMIKLQAVMGQLNVDDVVSKVESLKKSFDDMSKSAVDSTKTIGKKVTETGKTFAQKFPKSVAIATGALSGFAQGMRNVVALGKGVIGFFGSLVDGLVSVAASIIAIPFKMFSGLVDLAANATGTTELAEAIEALRKQFGALSGPTNKAIVNTASSLKGFSDTGLSAWRVFGTLAERLNSIRELATEMGGAFSKVRKEFEDNGGALLAYQKGLGISNEDMKGIVRNAVSMGKKTSDSLKEMTKQSYALGDAFGLDAKLISRDMSKALSDVKHFGGATVKQIAEASTYARKLGFELKDITGTLDAFDTFDTAAENAAKLSQAFGVNIDAFEMMKAQSPAEQLELLRKSFKSAGVDASNFDRASLKLAATTTGLSEDIVQSALSMKNQGMSLNEIKKKSGDAEKKTMTQAQAMGQLSDAIERLVKQGSAMKGGFFDTFIQGILGGIQSSQEFRTVMMEIRMALMQVRMVGVQLGRDLVNIVPGFKDIGQGLMKIFEPKHFTKLFQDISDAVRAFFDPHSTQEGSIPGMMQSFQGAISNFFSTESEGGKRVLDGFKKFFVMAGKLVSDGIIWASDRVGEGLRTIVDLITGKKKAGDLGGVGGEALGFLAPIFNKIIASLKHAWTAISPALFDLFEVLMDKLVVFVKTNESFHKAAKKVLPGLALVLFGPAFGRAMLGGLTSSLIKGVFSETGMKFIGKALKPLLTGEGGGMFTKVLRVAGPVGLIAGAATAIGGGVQKYTDEITSVTDKSTRVIAAGATGLIDALTLGLLPKDWTVTIANVMAQLADGVFTAMSSVFGSGFAESYKRQLAGVFDVLGGTYGLVASIFNDDPEAMDKAASELGYSLLRLMTAAFEYTVVQLPNLAARVAVKVSEVVIKIFNHISQAISKEIAKLVAHATSIFTGSIVDDAAIDKTFADRTKMIDTKTASWSQSLRDKMKNDANKQGSVIASFTDKYLRSDEDKAKIASKGQATPVAEAVKDADKATASISDVAANIATIKDVQKQLDDPKFNIAAAIKSIKTKFGEAGDLKFIDDSKMIDLEKTAANMEKLAVILTQTKSSIEILTDLPAMFQKMTKVIGKEGAMPAMQAAVDMISYVNKLNDALAAGNLNKIDIKANLEKFASAVGLGGKASYTVNPSKEVQITVNLQVTMDAGKVERVILEHKGSILRDRINFATENPTERGDSKISDTFGSTPKEIHPAGTK